MRVWRLMAIGAVVVLAACSSTEEGPVARPLPTIPADPAAALSAARADLGKESARFAVDGESTAFQYAGVVDAGSGNWEITGKEYVVRRVGEELFVKARGRTLSTMILPPATTERLAAGGWVRTRLPGARELSMVFNDRFPWILADPAARAGDLTKTGPRSLSGSGSTGGKRVDVGVDLDERGRFALISVTAAGTTLRFTFSDYGLATDIAAPPAAEVVDEENPTFLASTLLL